MNESRRTRGLAALAGVAAAALGLGVSEAIAGVLAGATSLIDAVGQVVVDLQPAGAKDVVVGLFGTNDKLALEIVVTVVALALGALFGVLAMRRFTFGAAGFAIFGVIGFIAALGQPLASPAIVAVQAAASVAVAIQTLSWLLGRLSPAEGRSTITDPARRSFLLRTTAVGIGALAVGAFGRTAIASSTSSPTPSTPLPPPVDVVPPLPAEADLAPSTPGLTPIVVPNDDFYRIDTALLVPVARDRDMATAHPRPRRARDDADLGPADLAADVRAVLHDRLREQRGRRTPRGQHQVDRRPPA